MPYSSADKWRVFLAYRTVFTGPYAQIRKSKKVREVIEQHKASFKPLIKDFEFNKVVNIVKTLLDQRVFESKLKAKIVFPSSSKPHQPAMSNRTSRKMMLLGPQQKL